MNVSDLSASEYDLYYKTYINKVPDETTLIEGFKLGQTQIVDFFKSIPDNKLEFRYAPDKWSVKDIFQHIIDTERVFMYRCFRIARQDSKPLAGYEQDDYVVPSKANKKTLNDLIEEYLSVRQSFIILLKSLSKPDLNFIGKASGCPLSARAAAFIILGHEIHHVEVIKARYL